MDSNAGLFDHDCIDLTAHMTRGAFASVEFVGRLDGKLEKSWLAKNTSGHHTMLNE